jgi:hypothetical protein
MLSENLRSRFTSLLLFGTHPECMSRLPLVIPLGYLLLQAESVNSSLSGELAQGHLILSPLMGVYLAYHQTYQDIKRQEWVPP